MSKTNVNPLIGKMRKEYTHSARYEKHIPAATKAILETSKSFIRDEAEAEKNKAVFVRAISDSCNLSESTSKDILRAVAKNGEILSLPSNVKAALLTCYPQSFNRLKEKEKADQK